MLLPGTNVLGTILFLGGFLMAVGMGQLAGVAGEGPLTIVGGLLVGGADVAYRRWWAKSRLWNRKQGGIFLFIPLWVLGLIWVALGIYYTMRGPA